MPPIYLVASPAEKKLVKRLLTARTAGHSSPYHTAELQALRQEELDAAAVTRIAEAQTPPNTMEGFAEETQSGIDQYLLRLQRGIRSVDRELVSSSSPQHADFVQRRAEQVCQE